MPYPRQDLAAVHAVHVAFSAAAHAAAELERALITDGQLTLTRAAASLLAIATDHHAAADFDATTTLDAALVAIVQHSLTRRT